MCCTGEFFKIQHNQRRICQRFRHDAFGIGLERLADRIVIRIRVYDSTGYAHFFHGNRQQIESSAVYGGRQYDMVARLADIENGIVVCRLSGTGQHRCCAALQFTNFLCDAVVGRICQTAVKISGFLQIKKSAHLLRGFIFKRRTLINREHSRLSVLRLPARLYADRFLCVCHSILLPLCLSDKNPVFCPFYSSSQL